MNLVATAIFRRTGRLTKAQWAMGWGDPILLLAIGLFVGMGHLMLVVFLASALGSVVGIFSRIFSRDGYHDDDIAHGALPFGPFLAIAAIYAYMA